MYSDLVSDRSEAEYLFSTKIKHSIPHWTIIDPNQPSDGNAILPEEPTQIMPISSPTPFKSGRVRIIVTATTMPSWNIIWMVILGIAGKRNVKLVQFSSYSCQGSRMRSNREISPSVHLAARASLQKQYLSHLPMHLVVTEYSLQARAR